MSQSVDSTPMTSPTLPSAALERIREQLTTDQRTRVVHRAALAAQLQSEPSLAYDDVMLRTRTSHNLALADIADALDRIDHGRYGLCERCETPVPTVRLEILPTARRCMPCHRETYRS